MRVCVYICKQYRRSNEATVSNWVDKVKFRKADIWWIHKLQGMQSVVSLIIQSSPFLTQNKFKDHYIQFFLKKSSEQLLLLDYCQRPTYLPTFSKNSFCLERAKRTAFTNAKLRVRLPSECLKKKPWENEIIYFSDI